MTCNDMQCTLCRKMTNVVIRVGKKQACLTCWIEMLEKTEEFFGIKENRNEDRNCTQKQE